MTRICRAASTGFAVLIVLVATSSGLSAQLSHVAAAPLSHTVTTQNTFVCVAGPFSDSIAAGSSLAPTNGMSVQHVNPFGIVCSWAYGDYEVSTSPTSLGLSIVEYAWVVYSCGTSNPPSTGVNESLWVIESRKPVSGWLKISGSVQGLCQAIGQGVCTLDVDIDDDGTVDWVAPLGMPETMSMQFFVDGARSFRIRSGVLGLGAAGSLSLDMIFSLDAGKERFGFGCGSPPVDLDSDLPVLGSAWNLTTTGVDPQSPFAVTFFGARGQPVTFTSLGLGASNCLAYLQTLDGAVVAPNLGGTATATIAVPPTLALGGVVMACQSVCLTTSSAAGLLSSNGLDVGLGH